MIGREGKDLLGEVHVDEGGLLAESISGVGGDLGLLTGGLVGVLVDAEELKAGVVALVEDELVALLLHDEIPGVDGLAGRHEGGQDGVRGVDGAGLLLAELLHDGILGGGGLVELAVLGPVALENLLS